MDRQTFHKLVREKLASLKLQSLEVITESDDALTVEVVSDSFIGLSLLKRISTVYDLISDEIKAIDSHVDIITLTLNEKLMGSDEQRDNEFQKKSTSKGHAASPAL